MAEILIDVAAEYHEMGNAAKTADALEAAIPYLNLPDQVVDVQLAWYNKVLKDLPDGSERYQATKQRRREIKKTKARLPSPKKDDAAVKASFLPEGATLAPKKKQGGGGKGKNSKGKKKK